MATYVFVDEWHVSAPVEAVYGLLSCPREYPAWWGEVFLRAEGDASPAAPGKRARLLRPLFAWNHRWAMARGEERIVAALTRGGSGEAREAGAQAVTPVR